MDRYLKKNGNADHISAWKSKGLSDENIKPPTASDNGLAPAISYICNKTRAKLDGSCLKQDKITFTRGKTVNIYIVYEINLSNYVHSSDPTLGNFLFGAVKLVKNPDINKYNYSGYSIGFDVKVTFGFRAIGFGRNIIIFGADMDSSVHIDNKKKYILLPGKCPTQGLDYTTLAAEKMYWINFIRHNKELCL